MPCCTRRPPAGLFVLVVAVAAAAVPAAAVLNHTGTNPNMKTNMGNIELTVAEGRDLVLLNHGRNDTRISLVGIAAHLKSLEGWAATVPDLIEAPVGQLTASLDDFKTQSAEDLRATNSAVHQVTDSLTTMSDSLRIVISSEIDALRTETSKSIDDTTKILAAQIVAAASKSTSDLDKLRQEAAATAQTMGEEIKAIGDAASKAIDDSAKTLAAQIAAAASKTSSEVDSKLEVLEDKLNKAIATPAPLTEKNTPRCTSAITGMIRFNAAAASVEICVQNAWGPLLRPGTASNPAPDCFAMKDKPEGRYWISVFGGARQVYCKDGWALAGVIFTGNCLDHYNQGEVRSANFDTLHPSTTSATTKWSDADINKYRSISTYKGDRDIMMSADSLCGARKLYCHTECNFNAQASIGSGRCSLCAPTESSGFSQGSPNSGTRGLGHHHWQPSWWGYVRHPEGGCGNPGFRSDHCGASSGELWIR